MEGKESHIQDPEEAVRRMMQILKDANPGAYVDESGKVDEEKLRAAAVVAVRQGARPRE